MFEAFLNIQQREDFSDVTLVTDDGQVMKAHRVILGACSTFFGNIFQKANVRDLCLYLPGVVQADLKSILDFVYNGQTDIPADSLDSFTKTAEQLKIKGLAEVENQNSIDDTSTSESRDFSLETTVEEQNVTENEEQQFAMNTSLEEHTEGTTFSDSNAKFDSSNVKVEMVEISNQSLDDGNETVITEEMSKAIDLESRGAKLKCDLCDFEYSRKDRLRRHMIYAHTKIEVIKCTKCDYSAKDKEELKQHTESTHKRTPKPKKPTNVFPCDKCDYRARTSENLERHLKFIVHRPRDE